MESNREIGSTGGGRKGPLRVLHILLNAFGGYYLTAGAVAVASILLFAWLAEEVLENEYAGLNRGVLLWINGYEGDILTTLAHTLSWIGSTYGVALTALIIGVFWYREKRYIDMWTFAILLAGSAVLTQVLKASFQQIRPHVFAPLAVELSFSFPSGHSLTAFSLWGYLGLLPILVNPRRLASWVMLAAGVVVAGSIALSRLYLGVHWPTDVMAGMVSAAFWLSACLSVRRWATDRRDRRMAAAEAEIRAEEENA